MIYPDGPQQLTLDDYLMGFVFKVGTTPRQLLTILTHTPERSDHPERFHKLMEQGITWTQAHALMYRQDEVSIADQPDTAPTTVSAPRWVRSPSYVRVGDIISIAQPGCPYGCPRRRGEALDVMSLDTDIIMVTSTNVQYAYQAGLDVDYALASGIIPWGEGSRQAFKLANRLDNYIDCTTPKSTKTGPAARAKRPA